MLLVNKHIRILLPKLFFLAGLLFSFYTTAQDKIHLINGIIINAKIQQVTESEILYKKFNAPDGPQLNVKKNDVKMVVYENGEKVLFTQTSSGFSTKPTYLTSISSDERYNNDIIVTVKTETIYCTITNSGKESISYTIKRRGPDPQSQILMADVEKYYYKRNWNDGYGNPMTVDDTRQKARELILNHNLNKALEAYSTLLGKDSLNVILLAEDAYVLALAGLYDVALYRLDRSWSIGSKSSDLNYFTAQVFALMGYDDLSKEFWKESEKNKIPKWIKPKANELLNKYKRDNKFRSAPSEEETVSKFRIANILASQNSYIQSIAIFQDLTYFYPNEYLPYVGYSITLEKAGAINKSAEAIEKAISLLGNTPEDLENKKIYEQRLKDLQKRMVKLPPNFLPGLYQVNAFDPNRPQMMTYVGGMFSQNMTNVNFRLGYFMTGKSNGAVDFAYTKTPETSFTNFGLSVYTRSKIFVSGVGLSLLSNNGNTNASYKLSVGLSIMNKKKTSSFDFFIDLNNGFKKESISYYMISIGTSLYFGKR